MNRKAAIPLVLGLVIGLVAVKLMLDSVKRAQGANQAQQKFAVVQAKVDIGAYEEILPEMVREVEINDSVLAPPQERLSGVQLAVGRVTSKPIPQNAPVLKSMLAAEGTKARMVGRIPPGFRAVSVKTDEVTGVAYQLQPGDWVDVIVVMDLETGARAKKETIAEVILQHVQVAAVGQGSSVEPESAGGKVKPAKSATLLVREEDVPKLHLAATRGKVTLAMRGEDDKTMAQPPVAYGSEIGAHGSSAEAPPVTPKVKQPVPEPRPVLAAEPPKPAPHLVSVYRGSFTGNQPATAIERITFESAKSGRILEVATGSPTRASETMSTLRKATNVPPAATQPSAENQTRPDVPSDEDYDVTEDNPKSQTGGE